MQFKGNNAAYKTMRPAETAGIYPDSSRVRSPFWLPASGYYGMSAAAASIIFVLVFGLLQDNGYEYALFLACASAIAAIAAAVLLREIILRTARERLAAARRRLDANMRSAIAINGTSSVNAAKLTLEQNAELLRTIRERSDAAKVLGGIAEGHRKVFDLCENYLVAVRRELPNVGVGSPRIAAFRRGTRLVSAAHRFHLLRWAEIEAQTFTRKGLEAKRYRGKIAASQAALDVVEFALTHYPNEGELLASAAVLRDHIEGLRIMDLIEQAEKAAARGNKKRAAALYTKAGDILTDEGILTDERRAALKKIQAKYNKLFADDRD